MRTEAVGGSDGTSQPTPKGGYRKAMSTKDEVREFLISRRAHLTPEQAGLPDFGGERRVPGLRREEVAMLAGVSLDYYTRLERGQIRGASESVLHAIARALQLNDVEREYLLDLARTAAATSAARSRPPARPSVRASVQRVLDNLAVPAVVFNAQQDLIASNLMGRALFWPHFEAERPNLARFIFLDPRARDYYVDWPLARSMTAAMLRLEAGRDPLNRALTALMLLAAGLLQLQSGEIADRMENQWSLWVATQNRSWQQSARHCQAGCSNALPIEAVRAINEGRRWRALIERGA